MNWNDLFAYKNGKLFWKVSPGRSTPIGKEVGSLNSRGYVRTKVGGRHAYIHRIVWEMHNGPIPAGLEIDHINRDRADNRIENLRVVSSATNKMNVTSKHQFKGVYPQGQRWVARIFVKSRGFYLGTFDTPEDAALAFNAAALEVHGPAYTFNEVVI